MKNTILILISLLFLTGVSEGKEVSSLQDRGGVKYEVNSEVGFTGKYTKRKIISGEMGQGVEGHFKLGVRHGLYTRWYNSLQKKFEGNYKDGKEEGLHDQWYKSGQKKFEGNYKDGKEEGLHVKWHENGQKEFEGNYKGGKEEGLHAKWYKSGQKEFEGNLRHGKGTWWDENGHKQKDIFTAEELYRLEQHWESEKSTRSKYEDGVFIASKSTPSTSWNENGQKKEEPLISYVLIIIMVIALLGIRSWKKDTNKTKEKKFNQDQFRQEKERKERQQQSRQKTEKPKNSNEKKRSYEEVLGLSPGWTKSDLKDAYKRKCHQTHPDKWKTFPEDIVRRLEKEYKEVQNAYKNLSKK